MSDLIRCGVCGADTTPDEFFEPPTVLEEADAETGAVRLVLSKPMRTDPDTGAVCWCSNAPPG